MGWNDEWSASTSYTADNIVRFENNTYKCKSSIALATHTPSGVSDPNSGWTNESKAIDDSTDLMSFTYMTVGASSWSDPLVFTDSERSISQIKYFINDQCASTDVNKIKVEVYIDSTWTSVYNDSITGWDAWQTITLSSIVVSDRFRITLYNSDTSSGTAAINEVSFIGVSNPPDDPTHWQRLTGGMLCNF